MDNLIPVGHDVLKLINVSERGCNQAWVFGLGIMYTPNSIPIPNIYKF